MFRYILMLYISVVVADETVRYAAVIFRHGDRTPVDPYPTDPYRNQSFWPVKFGQLTNTGKKQHYELGKWLRSRYQHLLSVTFDHNQIEVKSTDVDRTLMSAQANMAGMYPPVGTSVWNDHLLWQPIPVHTKPEVEDEVLAMKKKCPPYDKEVEKWKHTKTYVDGLTKYQPLMDYLTAYTGKKIKDYADINDIYNNLYIESLYNFSLPDWTKGYYPEKMREPACYSFTTWAATTPMARLKAGPLLKEIMGKIKKAMGRKKQDALKLSVYSGHDITIGTLLTTLGLFDGRCPVYTATIFIELIYDAKAAAYFIRVSYRNSTEIVEPHVLSIPYCGKRCPVDRFAELYQNILSVNFQEECFKQQPPGAVAVATSIGLLLMVAVIVAYRIHANRNSRTTGSHYAYTTVNSSGKVVFV